jgi:hypothetical protein
VSKRKDSRHRSGRSPDWIKSKNPGAPAVMREAEEDWDDDPGCLNEFATKWRQRVAAAGPKAAVCRCFAARHTTSPPQFRAI